MKKITYLMMIAVLGTISVSNAQAQNQECMTNLSIFSEHVKVKNYDAAYEPWKMVYETCPTLHRATYAYGDRILKDKIKNATGVEKTAFIEDLFAMYDNSVTHFAKRYSKESVAIRKAMVMHGEKMGTDDEYYKFLHMAFMGDRDNFTSPRALYLYFSSLVNLHNAGSKDLQSVFDCYDDATERIEVENKKLLDVISKLQPKEEAGTLTSKETRALKRATTNSESFGKIAGSIDTKLGELAECENLIPLYQKSYEAKKNDITWVKRAVGRMYSKECTEDPMFVKLVEAQNALDQSADSEFYLGILKQKVGDTRGAVAHFNKSVELESDNYKKSNILYKIAFMYRRGSKSTARNYAQKAINANPSNGKAYLMIANLYASSANQCGSTAFEKRAMYWKAANMARKAGRVDPSLRGRANKTAASYIGRAPDKTMIFNNDMAGKTVTFNCWVGGSVKVPNL
ncbi:MAG: hypothetical protein COA50_00795 [Flavobacteriaceae bacterium]|nr:MAG: hypothetical protein COA50_00795 [Flavobacteriaceae bacterium]